MDTDCVVLEVGSIILYTLYLNLSLKMVMDAVHFSGYIVFSICVVMGN